MVAVVTLLAYAIAVSLLVPLGFFLLGPVPERRVLLGSTYAVLIALGWCAALLLGWLSPVALAGAAALLATLGLLAAWYSLRDEQLLARFDARLGSAETRAEALEELRARIDEIGDEGHHVVALMEVVGHPARRLITRGLHGEALELLDYVATHLGARLGAVDASEHRLLRARALLHLERPDAAAALLAADRGAGSAQPAEADGLEALLASCRGELDRAERLLGHSAVRPWASWTRPIHLLARAHVAAARGDGGDAIEALKEVPGYARASTFQLARALPGPASELAARLEHPGSPYR